MAIPCMWIKPTPWACCTSYSRLGSVSPSIYIGFQTLEGYNLCGLVGAPLIKTTVAFAPEDLSTLLPRAFEDVHSAETLPPRRLNLADLSQNCSTISGYQWFPNNPDNAEGNGMRRDPCHPIMQYRQKF